MEQQFYSLLTTRGLEKYAAAVVNGAAIRLTHIAVGDADYIPDGTETTLQNEAYRTNISRILFDGDSHDKLIAETIIDGDTGGFWIREVGIIDADGELFAVGRYPATYKPKLSEGAVKDLCIRMVMQISNAANVSLVYNGGEFINQNPQIQVRSGTTAAHSLFQWMNNEIAHDTDKKTIVLHDAETRGGFPLAREDMDNVTDDIIRFRIGFTAADMVGVIFAAPLNEMPGCLLCDGAEVSRELYAVLFTRIGITFGAGHDNTTFRIPDYRGFFLRGHGHNSANIGVIQLESVPNITGSIGIGGASFDGAPTGAFARTTGASTRSGSNNGSHPTMTIDASRSSSVYGRANEVRPRNHAINFFIKF